MCASENQYKWFKTVFLTIPKAVVAPDQVFLNDYLKEVFLTVRPLRLGSWIPHHYTGPVMLVISMFLKVASSERPQGREVKKYLLTSECKINNFTQ